ncbi:hypothetical protein KY284_020196 [Solanum tuberosum]|nr:hypothetical protein KY284_020196 [Solanum tuberosum]
MSEFVTQLIPTLIEHILSVVLERIHEVISSPPIDNPSSVTHVVHPASINVEEDDPLVSDADRSP